MTDIPFTSAVEIAELVRSREISVTDVAGVLNQRIEAVNPIINAYVYHDPESVLKQANELDQVKTERGPLHGIPYSIKDLTPIAGLPQTMGMVALKDQVAGSTARMVSRMQDAGGLFLGKTNSPELGYYGVTDNHLFGATQNPWKPGYISGGSSGGAAAAVAAGLGPLAEGSDGAGSVRIPASCCGVFGLKPSFGRIPQGMISDFSIYVHHGPITRTVADAALMLSVTEGIDDSDPLSLPSPGIDYLEEIKKEIRGWRIGWSPDLGFAEVDDEIIELCGQAVAAFEDLGCAVTESHPGWPDPEEAMWNGIWLPGYAGMNDFVRNLENLDAQLVQLADTGANLPFPRFIQAKQFRAEMWRLLTVWFRDFDLLVCPTLCVAPFANGQFAPDRLLDQPLQRQLMGWLLTYPFNMMAPCPAATLPCGFTRDGLPVGLQLVAKPHADADLLRAAANFERARPWAKARPDL